MRWPEYGGGSVPWAPHTCGLSENGDAFCWGNPYYGSLGNGMTLCVECPRISVSEPSQVLGGPYAAISSGRGHTCALYVDGQADCWGDYAQLEVGQRWNQPGPLAGGPHHFESIAVADDHACGIDREGTLLCWGENRWGQLGWPSTGLHPKAAEPIQVPGGLGFVSVYVGPGHTCALKGDGRAYCWGRNDFGQLGTGDVNELCIEGSNNTRGCETDPAGPRPVDQGPTRFFTLAVGQLHTCGLSVAGEAFCWGRGKAGQLGVPDEEVRTPVRVQTDVLFTRIAAGARHTCGISTEGRAYCWGWGQLGQLGLGKNRNTSVPEEVVGQPQSTEASQKP